MTEKRDSSKILITELVAAVADTQGGWTGLKMRDESGKEHSLAISQHVAGQLLHVLTARPTTRSGSPAQAGALLRMEGCSLSTAKGYGYLLEVFVSPETAVPFLIEEATFPQFQRFVGTWTPPTTAQ